MLAIARNLAIDLTRRRRREVPGEVPTMGPDPDRSDLVDALTALTPVEREIVVALHVFGHQGRREEALATWEQALETDPETISARYSRVFLLQRLGRLEEAIVEWEAIVAWLVDHDYPVQTEWPKREIARLRAALASQ